MKSLNTTNPYNRHDTSIVNVILMLKPVLEEMELIGTTMTATELARICRNRKARLPIRSYQGLRLADEIGFLADYGSIQIGDLDVAIYREVDPHTRRRSPRIEFQRAVSLEQQYLDSLQQSNPQQQTQPEEETK